MPVLFLLLPTLRRPTSEPLVDGGWLGWISFLFLDRSEMTDDACRKEGEALHFGYGVQQ